MMGPRGYYSWQVTKHREEQIKGSLDRKCNIWQRGLSVPNRFSLFRFKRVGCYGSWWLFSSSLAMKLLNSLSVNTTRPSIFMGLMVPFFISIYSFALEILKRSAASGIVYNFSMLINIYMPVSICQYLSKKVLTNDYGYI